MRGESSRRLTAPEGRGSKNVELAIVLWSRDHRERSAPMLLKSLPAQLRFERRRAIVLAQLAINSHRLF